MVTAHYNRPFNFAILTGCIVFLLALQLVEGRVRRTSKDGSTPSQAARTSKATALSCGWHRSCASRCWP